nr:hypothetical protein BaRGS_011891 [Batillaria attramentaria]
MEKELTDIGRRVDGPKRPTVSQQFTVHVEAVMVDKNQTFEFIEYYDYLNNRGRLHQTQGGHVTDYYYDYNTNEMLIVRPDDYTCTVQPLSQSPYVFVMGDKNNHIYSPGAALRFGAAGSPETYLGKSSVRDILVNQWQSCMDWPDRNTTMTVTWSFVGVYKTLLEYFEAEFKYAVRHNIAQAISVSPLRIANIAYRVQQMSLDVAFDLLSVPNVHSRVVDPATELPLDQATQRLADAVRDNRLVIELNVNPDQGKAETVITSQDQSKLFPTSLHRMQATYHDVLADFHCLDKDVYQLQLFTPTYHQNKVNGTDGASQRCLHFYYHMHGLGIGTLNVYATNLTTTSQLPPPIWSRDHHHRATNDYFQQL